MIRPSSIDAAAQDPEIAALRREFAEIAAQLSGEAPQHAPPSALRDRILRRLDAPRSAPVRILQFPRLVLPYALAACLMGLVLIQTALIQKLNQRLGSARSAALRVMPRTFSSRTSRRRAITARPR